MDHQAFLATDYTDKIRINPCNPWLAFVQKIGFEIDIDWKNGRLDGAVIRSIADTDCHVRYKEKTVRLRTKPGAMVRITRS